LDLGERTDAVYL